MLNKDVKQHGKAFMFDGLDDTAWYSDQVMCLFLSLFLSFSNKSVSIIQGLPQTINIVFNEPLESLDLRSSQLKIKFQGGFVGSVMRVSIENSSNQNIFKKHFYPDDINDMQSFPLEYSDVDMPQSPTSLENVRKLSIVFEKSSDFFGRVIIYHLEMFP